MGFRFRKSLKFGPIRINLSKSGVGYSIGTKGYRVTKKANGGYRTTASIPGTGISHVKDYSAKTALAGGDTMAKKKTGAGNSPVNGLLIGTIIGVGILVLFLGASGAGDQPHTSDVSAQASNSVSVSSDAASAELPVSTELPTESVSPENPASDSDLEPVAPPSVSSQPIAPDSDQSVSQSEPDEEPVVQTYIGNKNSWVFHWPSCDSVSKMKEKNKVTLESRDYAISRGYDPCDRCNP